MYCAVLSAPFTKVAPRVPIATRSVFASNIATSCALVTLNELLTVPPSMRTFITPLLLSPHLLNAGEFVTVHTYSALSRRLTSHCDSLALLNMRMYCVSR